LIDSGKLNKNDRKYLVVKVAGGMGNRMLCTLTGILYGQLTGRCTIVDWRDESYSNDGSNTFLSFFSCPCIYPETILPYEATIRPKVWEGQLHKFVMEMIGEHDPDKFRSITIHRKYSIDVRRLDYDEDILVFWYYTGRIRSLRKHLRNRQDGYAGLDIDGIIRKVLTEQMILRKDIRQRINDFKAKNWSEKVIGVHIRHTDRKTNLAKYERYLNQLLERYQNARIFLATDNYTINKSYHKRFKNVFSTPKWYPDGISSMHQNRTCPDKVANGIEALVDMYLLAECNYLIYSGYSTFSLISRILSNALSEDIVDIDRFNLIVWLKQWIRELVA